MPESITCPVCGKVSHNANDIKEKFCCFCHYFWGDIKAHVHGTVTSDNIDAFKAVIEAGHNKLREILEQKSEAQSNTCACPHPDPFFCYEVRYQDYMNESNESCECFCHNEYWEEDVDYL